MLAAMLISLAVWASFNRYAAAGAEQTESIIRRHLLNDLKFAQRATLRKLHIGFDIASELAESLEKVIETAGSRKDMAADYAAILSSGSVALPGRYRWTILAVASQSEKAIIEGNELQEMLSSGENDRIEAEILRLLAYRGLSHLTDLNISHEFREESSRKFKSYLDDKADAELTRFVCSAARCFQPCFINNRQFHFMWFPILKKGRSAESESLMAAIESDTTTSQSLGQVKALVVIVFDEDNYRQACEERFDNGLIDNFGRLGASIALSPAKESKRLSGWVQSHDFENYPELAEARRLHARGVVRTKKWLYAQAALPDLSNRNIVIARQVSAEMPSIQRLRKVVFSLLVAWFALIVYFCGNHLVMRKKIRAGLRVQLAVLVSIFLLPPFLLATVSLERYLDSTMNSSLQRIRSESEEALDAFDKSIKLFRTRICSLADNLIHQAESRKVEIKLDEMSDHDKKEWLGSFLDTFIVNGVVMKNVLLVGDRGRMVSRFVGSNSSEEKFFQHLGASIFLPTLQAMNPALGAGDEKDVLLKAQAEELLGIMGSVLLPEIFPAMAHTFTHLTKLSGFGDHAFLYHRFLREESSVNGALLVAVYSPSLECVAFNRWVTNFDQSSFRPVWLIKKKNAPGWYLKAPFGRVASGGKFGLMRFVYGLLPDKIALMAHLSCYAAEPLVLDLDWEEQKWFFATLPGYDLIDYQLSALIPVTSNIQNYRRFQSELRLSMVLIFILCGYIGWKMAAGFVVPVKCFAETAEKLIDGDLSARMNEDWSDEEFCQIARSFNQVAADVETGRILRKFVSDGALQTITASEKIDRKRSLQSRNAVIMFIRVAGVTDAFKDNAAAQMVAELNRFFSAVCSSVKQNGGEVSKFIAEKAMVTFFIDSEEETGIKTVAAVKSALVVLERLRRHKFLDGTIKIRAGITTGMVRSGIIGSETTRLEQAVIGDVVNLAARLCSLDTGKEIVFCSATWAALKNVAADGAEYARNAVRLPGQLIKGKKQMVEAFALSSELYRE